MAHGPNPSPQPKESVRQILGALHAERLKTMDPAALKINIDQRATLVATADRAGFVKAGDLAAPFTLPEVDGGQLELDALLAKGPVVLIFFRFAGCPACNLALPYYQRNLAPALKDPGATLIAVSPQVPERLVDIKRRHDFDFAVASDLGNALGRRFGILYSFDEASKAAAIARGSSIGEVTGAGTWELPMPTVVVIGQDRRVRFADVSPDWMVRTEAEPVIEAVRGLTLASAAE
ncbi:MAG: peroxiredoxin-like family protein [Caulobacteraceae bacterium]|nr:peroxiredoxin-like family protein [Caulobacteraceae bacterium]